MQFLRGAVTDLYTAPQGGTYLSPHTLTHPQFTLRPINKLGETDEDTCRDFNRNARSKFSGYCDYGGLVRFIVGLHKEKAT